MPGNVLLVMAAFTIPGGKLTDRWAARAVSRSAFSSTGSAPDERGSPGLGVLIFG